MRLLFISILIISLAPLAALGGPLSLVVSISPQLEAVRAIAGDDARIIVLVPKGASPETYSPSAGEMLRLAKADILFTIGVPMEKALVTKLRRLNGKLQIVDAASGMKYRDMEGGHDGHPHGAKDPHVWLSIDNMIIHARNVSRSLSEKDAGNAEAYTARANTYI
ncbi:MAG: zinc ABC transporter substrate-binding protein, partial [Victivallales bacterium]|nr:zinc ABC transporter substrate-binding protein [Victivallales bacterium]